MSLIPYDFLNVHANSLKSLYALTGRKRIILIVFAPLSIVHMGLGAASMVVARHARKQTSRGELYTRTDACYSDGYSPARTLPDLFPGFTTHFYYPGSLHSLLLGLRLGYPPGLPPRAPTKPSCNRHFIVTDPCTSFLLDMWKEVHLAGRLKGHRAGFRSIFPSGPRIALLDGTVHGNRPCEHYKDRRKRSGLMVPFYSRT